jgi:hypothetical protein
VKRKENPKDVFGHKLAKHQIVARWSEEGICFFRWRDKRDEFLLLPNSDVNSHPLKDRAEEHWKLLWDKIS